MVCYLSINGKSCDRFITRISLVFGLNKPLWFASGSFVINISVFRSHVDKSWITVKQNVNILVCPPKRVSLISTRSLSGVSAETSFLQSFCRETLCGLNSKACQSPIETPSSSGCRTSWVNDWTSEWKVDNIECTFGRLFRTKWLELLVEPFHSPTSPLLQLHIRAR